MRGVLHNMMKRQGEKARSARTHMFMSSGFSSMNPHHQGREVGELCAGARAGRRVQPGRVHGGQDGRPAVGARAAIESATGLAQDTLNLKNLADKRDAYIVAISLSDPSNVVVMHDMLQ